VVVAAAVAMLCSMQLTFLLFICLHSNGVFIMIATCTVAMKLHCNSIVTITIRPRRGRWAT
jgi:hypothetical protein